MYVIGLGEAGCNIAKCFGKYPQYKKIRIDTNDTAEIQIDTQSSHEDYEARFPTLKELGDIVDSDCLVVVSGSGRISGGILRLLEQIASNNVKILYIQPDLELLSEVQKKQERVVKNVLQEYTRSGMLSEMMIVDNVAVEKGIGDLPIIGYYDILNQAIVNTLHMINVFANTKPVLGNFVTPSEISRISTIGIMSMDEMEEKWFFDLTAPRDVVYYYGINEEELKTNGSLFKTITSYIKSKKRGDANISYGVFQTSYEQKFCYCISYSSVVQSNLDDQEIN